MFKPKNLLECWDGGDEVNCVSCDTGLYWCGTANHCISQENVCDGNRDCLGGQDEEFCNTWGAWAEWDFTACSQPQCRSVLCKHFLKCFAVYWKFPAKSGQKRHF